MLSPPDGSPPRAPPPTATCCAAGPPPPSGSSPRSACAPTPSPRSPSPAFLAELRRRHADDAAPYDLVVLALVGGAVQAALHGLARLGQDHGVRPVVVTGYVGVVYEKLADGLLLRHGADLVLANSAVDAERFRAVYEGVGADSTAVTEAALPFLGGAPHRPADSGNRPYTVVFAAQPSVPMRPRRPRPPAGPAHRPRPRPPGARGAAQAALQARRAHHAPGGDPLPAARPRPGTAAGELPPGPRQHGRGPGPHRPAGHRQLHGRPGVAAPVDPHRGPHRPRGARGARQPPLHRLRLPHLLRPARRGPHPRRRPHLAGPQRRRPRHRLRERLRHRPRPHRRPAEAGRGGGTAADHAVLHPAHRPRLPARAARPPPPRARRHPAARRPRPRPRRGAARTGPHRRQRRGTRRRPRRLPARRPERRPLVRRLGRL